VVGALKEKRLPPVKEQIDGLRSGGAVRKAKRGSNVKKSTKEFAGRLQLDRQGPGSCQPSILPLWGTKGFAGRKSPIAKSRKTKRFRKRELPKQGTKGGKKSDTGVAKGHCGNSR